ncbi:hypothetical protein FPANT_6553 [Fusarium pseudoanthophilum]|uniref:DUF6546 domain-containing protein n=1 Tax=Fusarium pseudoanthophilum TaxID=48495 RepID=A0A8H5LE19_9HYPO|nr:hypothetical protein FPANT_6553 [Fusarium pseudoanthophilum]
MIAPKIIAITGLLVAGAQAGPCKPSSIATTTTETTATGAASTTGTPTNPDIATTTEMTLGPSSTAYNCANNEKTPFPAGVLCDTKGIGADPNMRYLTQVTGDATIAHCRDVCRGLDGCIAFAIQPNVFCDLWGGRVQGTDGSNTDFTWYSLDCFCDLPELPTTSAEATDTTATTDITSLITDTATTDTATSDTATTELEASPTVLTTSSAELASTTETTTAAATTTTAAFGCPGGFPADHSCGVFQQYTGGGQNYIKDYSGTYSVEECMQFCIDDDTCTLINHSSYFCELWTGDFITNGLSATWSCMAFASTTPMRPISYEWLSLPVELRLQIFGYVAEKQKYRATDFNRYACVSSEWQNYFERITFRRLLIDNSQLDPLSKATEGEKAVRLSYIRYLCLRIELQDYDYPECDTPEPHDTRNWNNQRFTNSLIELFNVLRRWEPSNNRDTGLILEITAYSPGDNKRFEVASMEYALHENFQLEEDVTSPLSVRGFRDAKEARDRREPGKNWHRPTIAQSWQRLQGTPLELSTEEYLKEVPIVHTLWIRHQFTRGIRRSSLIQILDMALTNVASFRFEAVPGRWNRSDYCHEWNNLILQLPSHIRRFSFNVFPRSPLPLEALLKNVEPGLPEALAEKAHQLASLCPPAGTKSLHFMQCLRESPQLEHGSRLAQLCLEVTDETLGKWGNVPLFQGLINHLLRESAVTARQLPKLQILEIWFHKDVNGFVFRYEHEKDQVTITWRVTEDWINLADGTLQQWMRGAQKYNVAFTVKEQPFIAEKLPEDFPILWRPIDRKTVYRSLKLRDLAIDPVTLVCI